MKTPDIEALYHPLGNEQRKPIFRKAPDGTRKKVAEVSYITARQVMDRLDEVFGVLGWSAEFRIIAEQTVLCRLHVRTPDGDVWKEDIGFSDNNNDADNGYKGAASDALKRAAVHLGIGRYLYDEPREQAHEEPQRSNTSWKARSQYPYQAPKGAATFRQREERPFGSEDELSGIQKLNALRVKYKWTDAQFRDAFGVIYSNEVVEQMLNDGMTAEEINSAIIG